MRHHIGGGGALHESHGAAAAGNVSRGWLRKRLVKYVVESSD